MNHFWFSHSRTPIKAGVECRNLSHGKKVMFL